MITALLKGPPVGHQASFSQDAGILLSPLLLAASLTCTEFERRRQTSTFNHLVCIFIRRYHPAFTWTSGRPDP